MRKRSAYRPRPVTVNAWQRAMIGAAKLPAAAVQMQTAIVRTAVDQFARGLHCAAHWLSLADTANMTETLAAMRIGAGAQADDIIERAQRALHDVHQRHAQRGTWTLYADEIDALQWLAQLHAVQLREVTRSEFEEAFTRTKNRLMGARAGNAPAGAIVIEGQIG